MKKFKTFLFSLIAILCLGNFSSCSSSDDNDGDGQLETPQYAADAAKYEITDASSEVKSIELTESGQYIVIMNNVGRNAKQTIGLHKIPATLTRATSENVGVYYGNYTKTDKDYFLLEDFGTVRINKDDNGSVASVTIHSNKSGNEWTSPARLSPKTNTNNTVTTNRICRTWKIKSVGLCYKLNGRALFDYTESSYKELYTKLKEYVKRENSDDWTNEDEEEYNQMIEEADSYMVKQLVFTKAGTILAKVGEGILADGWIWRWAGDNSNEIQAWYVDFDYNEDGEPDENEWRGLFTMFQPKGEPQGKTTATVNQRGQLVLEAHNDESDEEGPSLEMIETLTFDEAK